MMFSGFPLSQALVRGGAALGYLQATPVQVAAIPPILQGRDVWASARTGSGKTAAFVLPMLEWLSKARESEHPRVVRVLILVPTRELAVQIGEAIDTLGRHLDRRPKTCVVIGGVSINPQMMELRGGADIVVATPGRLLALVADNALRLSSVEMLVLDEADRLLALGFEDELAKVLALVTPRQRLLFSATFAPAVRVLAERLLHDPVRIEVDAGATLAETQAGIVQRVIEVDPPRRVELLCHLVSTHSWASVLVFVATRRDVDRVADDLRRMNIASAALHGDLSQGARTKALEDLEAGRVQVLVATDVAARGLDLTALSAVVNYDLPRSAADYLHRIGRTGRAGETGVAMSFISIDTADHFRLIEKRHHLHLERERIPGFEPTVLLPRERPAHDPHGGVKGKRMSKKDKLRARAKLNQA